MKKIALLIAGGGLLALLSATLPLRAADDTKLSDWNIGDIQVGDKVSKKDLEGQVVVFEYWGTR